jgi:hypothetical protein
MEEADAVLRARQLLQRVPLSTLPVPLDAYIAAAAAHLNGASIRLKVDNDLDDAESGHTVQLGGKHIVVLNGNHTEERRRFTACHEIAHLILALPTEHTSDQAGDGFIRRSFNEVLCDVFAAEMILPFKLIRDRVADSDFDFNAIEDLAGDFEASLTATGSRFAAVCDRPCAFVISHAGTVKYGARSNSLREMHGWVRPGITIPESSLAAHLRRKSAQRGPLDVPAVDWFDTWSRGGSVLEDARYLERWDQTLSLLWFDDSASVDRESGDDDPSALSELDGILPWPGKRRRR